MKLKYIQTLLIILFSIQMNAQDRRTSKTKVTTKNNTTTKQTIKNQQKNRNKEVAKQSKVKFTSFDLSKWSFQLEIGASPIKSLNYKDILSYQGSLGINYSITSKLNLGLFGQTLYYYKNNDVSSIDNKIIDMSSIEYNSIGIRAQYKYLMGKFNISPQMDIAYNFFLSKSIDFNQDKHAFLDYRYLTLSPKINLGINITESVNLGIYSGYNFQAIAFKGKIIEEYNPNGIMGGVFTLIQINK